MRNDPKVLIPHSLRDLAEEMASSVFDQSRALGYWHGHCESWIVVLFLKMLRGRAVKFEWAFYIAE